MTSGKITSALMLALAMTFMSSQSVAALSYEAIDVPNTVVGFDRMKYIYHLDGAFPPFHGFNLIFDSSLYANLDVTLPLGSDWQQLLVAPDPAAPLDGLLISTALADIADATAIFEVEFDWTGNGTPGAQPYEIFDDGFNIVSTARTVAFGATNVPEPATLALVVAGLLVLLMRASRRRAFPALPVVRA